MDAPKIQSALADITAERDPTVKSLKLASLCSALWAEHGVELVVVGGSAIEIKRFPGSRVIIVIDGIPEQEESTLTILHLSEAVQFICRFV